MTTYSPDLAGYWPLSDTTTYRGGGPLVGSPCTVGGSISNVSALISSGLQINSGDGFYRVSNSSSVEWAPGQFTLEGWIKLPGSGSKTGGIITKGDFYNVADRMWGLRIVSGSPDQLRFDIYNAANPDDEKYIQCPITVMDDGAFHHVAAKFNGTHIHLYIDGIYKIGQTVQGTYTPDTFFTYPIDIYLGNGDFNPIRAVFRGSEPHPFNPRRYHGHF